MDDLAIRRRVERTLQMCHVFDIEPDARTLAEIMADEDTASAKYERARLRRVRESGRPRARPTQGRSQIGLERSRRVPAFSLCGNGEP
jgi:ATP-dependent DNA ligase